MGENFFAGPFRDCAAVQRAGYTKSGIFNLKLPGYERKIRVWCDFDQVCKFNEQILKRLENQMLPCAQAQRKFTYIASRINTSLKRNKVGTKNLRHQLAHNL